MRLLQVNPGKTELWGFPEGHSHGDTRPLSPQGVGACGDWPCAPSRACLTPRVGVEATSEVGRAGAHSLVGAGKALGALHR